MNIAVEFEDRGAIILDCGGKRSATPLSQCVSLRKKRCRRCALPPHSKFFAFRHHEVRDSGIPSAFRFPAFHFF
jgi:hypothetical protein